MRIPRLWSHVLLQPGPALVALLLSACPAFAGSWSSTMQVSATVVSTCTLALDGQAVGPRVRSTCSRGEQAFISRTMTAPMAALPPELAQERGPGRIAYLVVTY